MGRTFALALAGVLAFGTLARADDEPKKEEPLSKRQHKLSEAYKQFEEKLNEAANAYMKLEPEKAGRLRRAHEASRQAFAVGDAGTDTKAIWQRMHEIVAQLEENRKDKDQAAIVLQKEVLDALENVLSILEADDAKRDSERQDPKRLAELRAELKKLIKDQKAHRDALAKAKALEAKARALAEASKKVDELLEKQRALTDETGAATPDAAAELAKVQREIEAQTTELEKLLDEVAKLGETPDEKGDAQPGEGKPGEGGETKPGEGGEAKPGAAQKAVESAKGAMKDAAKGLDEKDKPKAQERQRRSLEDLETAKKALDKKRMQIDRLAELERRKAELKKIEEETGKLAKKMGEQPGGQGGKPGQGGKQGQGGKGQPQAPGRRNVEKAQDEQKRAGDDLENRHVQEADEKEEQAQRNLEEAEEALREALIQARKREQEEVLKAMGQRFLAMLEKQKKITKDTDALDKERLADVPAPEPGKEPARSDLNRRQRLVCTALATGEGELRDETDQAIELAREEGSTTILPTVLGELREDLARLNELLAKHDTGRFVQSLQRDVERTLEELIEVIKREIEERKGGGGGGGGGGDDKNGNPLLPASAELKMIRAQQMRVNAKTKEFDVARPEGELTSDQREACRLIAEKQQRVAEFTRRLHQKLNKED